MPEKKKNRIIKCEWDNLLIEGVLLKLEHDLKEINRWLEEVIKYRLKG